MHHPHSAIYVDSTEHPRNPYLPIQKITTTLSYSMRGYAKTRHAKKTGNNPVHRMGGKDKLQSNNFLQSHSESLHGSKLYIQTLEYLNRLTNEFEQIILSE
ncbi:MAG: hypothetical protein WDZ49_16425 [Litorilinea sp.]